MSNHGLLAGGRSSRQVVLEAGTARLGAAVLVAVLAAPTSGCASLRPGRLVTNDAGKANQALLECRVVLLIPEGGSEPTTVYYPSVERCGAARPVSCSACRQVTWESGVRPPGASAGPRSPGTGVREGGWSDAGVFQPEFVSGMARLCQGNGPVPRFRPCGGQIVLVNQRQRSAARLGPAGGLSKVRWSGPLRVPFDLYRFVSIHEFNSGAWAAAGAQAAEENVLLVDASPPLSPGRAAEIWATLVHEGFHAFFQRVPIYDVTPITENRAPGLARPDTWAGRQRLEARYSTDAAFRELVRQEYGALLLALNALAAGDRSRAAGVLDAFLALRRVRWAGMTSEEKVLEGYWESVEGTAQFLEEAARDGSCRGGETAPGSAEPFSPSYFLSTGAALCAATHRIDAERFVSAVRPETVYDLVALLGTARQRLSE